MIKIKYKLIAILGILAIIGLMSNNSFGQTCYVDVMSPEGMIFPSNGGTQQLYITPSSTSCTIEITGYGGRDKDWIDVIDRGSYYDIVCDTNNGVARSLTLDIKLSGELAERYLVSQNGIFYGGQIANQEICYNTVPGTISFATPPSGGLEPYTYVWQKMDRNDIDWVDLPGPSSNTYTPTQPLTETTDFRAIVTSSLGEVAYATRGIVTVFNINPGIISGDQTICYDESAETISNILPAAGGSDSYEYSWQLSYDNSSWTDILFTSSLTYNPVSPSGDTYYRRKEVDTECNRAVYSNAVQVIVISETVITTQPQTQDIIVGETLSLTVETASFRDKFQWYKDNTLISDATSNTYTVPEFQMSDEGTYKCKVYTDCDVIYSDEAIITGYLPLNPGSIGGTKTICLGNSAGTLSNVLSASGCKAPIAYQWQYSFDDIEWIDIIGETDASYSPDHVYQTTHFRRSAFSALCGYEYTDKVTITVLEIDAGTLNGHQEISYNSKPSTFEFVTLPNGGSGYSCQWEKSTNGTDYNEIIGATGTSYTEPNNLTQTTYYRVKVSTSTCDTYTDRIVVTVWQPLSGGEIADQQICYNTVPGIIEFSIPPSGGNGIFSSYLWQKMDRITNEWEDLQQTDVNTYTPTQPLTESTDIRAVVTSSEGEVVYSEPGIITVYNINPGSIIGEQTICHNETPATLNDDGGPSGGSDSYEYSWQISTNNADWSDIPGTTDAISYNPGTLSSDSYFRRKEVDLICNETVFSNSVKITVKQGVEVTKQPQAQNLIIGEQLLLLLEATGINVTYQWYKDGSVIEGATSNEYDIENVDFSDIGNYKCELISDCETIFSNEVEINVRSLYNYIRTKTPLTEDYNLANIIDEYQYFDGLGRLIQTVNVGGSPTGKDLVKPYKYDELGREKKSYLPFSIANQGNFVEHDLLEQQTFYQNHLGLSSEEDPYAFAEKEFDSSPLSRITEQGAPGLTWQIDPSGSGNTMRFAYEGNKPDEVKCFEVDSENQLIVSDFYEEANLYKNTFRDENGTWSSEFKNSQEQVLLKVSDTINLKLKTYYVYDDFGLLRYVIPPKAVELIGTQTSGALNQDVINDLCYYYEYDGRKRMTIKKLPGADSVYMVYDKRDRMVFTQDGNLREDNKWLFTKYDTLNRPILTGIYLHDARIDQGSMQNVVNEQMTTFAEFVDDNYNGDNFGYTNASFPVLDANDEILTVTYYDNYDFDINGIDTYSSIRAYVESVDNTDFPASEITDAVRGQITGVISKVLGLTDSYILAASFYDDKYRVVRTYAENYLGGDDIFATQYDFTGNVLKTRQVHVKDGAATPVTINQRFEYDHALRLEEVFHQIDGENEIRMSAMEYNEMGELTTKKLHDKLQNDSYLQELNFNYNIRGWLTGINNPASLGNDLFAMQLAYDQAIDGLTSGFEANYNGNISSMVWINNKNGLAPATLTLADETINSARIASEEVTILSSSTLSPGTKIGIGTYIESPDQGSDESVVTAYQYAYDDVNRITEADYFEKDGTWSDITDYDLASVTYDANGNIETLSRYGLDGAHIDNLDYDYGNTNQLQYVDDFAADDGGFFDGNSGIDYDYDFNGNLKFDNNKDITNITYNYLNLPQEIDFGDGNRIVYIYDAGGVKLAKETYRDNNLDMEVVYAGNMIYEDASGDDYTLLTDEGKVSKTTAGLTYEYYLKDHLGNTRVMFHDDGTGNVLTDQVNDYYPFGMLFQKQNLDRNKYLYNGKELQEDVFNGVALDWYDYGARMYDAALAKFHTVDPLAETYNYQSPYVYANNNPVRFIDFMGMSGEDPNTHEIQKGDTYWGLAQNSNGAYSVEDLKAWNPGVDHKNLQIGQNINISDPRTIANVPANEYLMPNLTLDGGVQSMGPVVYQWAQYEVWLERMEDASGFWENEVKLETNWVGGFGFGDIGASKTSISLDPNVVMDLKTNSLLEILNYGSDKVTSHSGGFGYYFGTYQGYAKDGTLVWQMETTGGFTIGYSPPSTSHKVNWRINKSWYNGKMSEADSIKSAQINIKAARGDTVEYHNYLKKKSIK